MKILITAATSAQAYQLKNKLTEKDIILGDFTDLPIFIQKNIIRLPNPATDTYAHEMLALCLDLEVEQAYLLTKEEFAVLQASQQLFKEYNIDIIDGTNHL